jgi:citrate synthase
MSEEARKGAVRGLQDVIAAETRIGHVDGVNGKLYYAGYDVDELAGKVQFEEVVFLLWNDRLPTKQETLQLRAELVAQMKVPADTVAWFKALPASAHPMTVLRTAISALAISDPAPLDNSPAANQRKAVRVTAAVSTLIAALHQAQQGKDLIPANPKYTLAQNFLRLFLGRDIDEQESQAIELIFVLHAEHSLNASTFAARVTASTLADMYAAVTSALGCLSGPLHGGANQRVMEMLTDIGSAEVVDEYIESMVTRKEKIMGFGHREYKVEDPRAKHLHKISSQLCQRDRGCLYYQMSEKIERKVKKDKGIYPNVDFYSATVQHALGIPVEYYTTIFAASRIAGWTAHIMEQHADNRLMRPAANFTGPFPRPFIPIAKRR